jgi:hypothetical protein
MKQLDLAEGDSGQKKKSGSPASRRRANGPRQRAIRPEKKIAQVEPPLPAPVGRMERTRRLFLAALRVWELKRRVRD